MFDVAEIGGAARKYPAVFRLTRPGPADAARHWLRMALARSIDPRAYSARATVWNIVPPKPGRLPDAEEGGDRILLDDGTDKFVVTLRRENGLTLPESIEWWTARTKRQGR
jgi:hypothetical protein